jgi:hypothetical protein
VIFVLFLLAAWFISSYNRFIKYKNKIEEDIQKARNQYNRYVGKLNTQIESFPASLIARKFGFEKQNYFTLDLATQRELSEVVFPKSRGSGR